MLIVPTGIFGMAAPAAAAPANDSFADATPLFVGASVSGDTTGATREPGEHPTTCAVESDEDEVGTLWYSLRSEEAVPVIVTLDSPEDQGFAIYTGSSPDALEEVTCEDRGISGLQEEYEFRLGAGVTYMIAVAPFGVGDEGPFELAVAKVEPPANDEITGATALAVPDETSGTMAHATLSEGDPVPSCLGGATKNVWYRFAAPGDGAVLVELSSYSRAVAVYDEADLSETACGSGPARALSRVASGRTYLVMVAQEGSWGDDPFTIKTTFHPRPDNDDMAAATPLQFGTSAEGSTVLATSEPGEPIMDCGWWGEPRPARTLWYRITTEVDTVAAISLTNAGGHAFRLFDDTTGGLVPFPCVDDFGYWASDKVEARNHRLRAGSTYLLGVFVTSGGSGGTFTVALGPPANGPAGDDYTTARPIEDALMSGDTAPASIEAGEPTRRCGVSTRHTQWFEGFAPASGGVAYSTSAGTATVVTGATLDQSAEVSCVRTTAGDVVRLPAGQPYRIVVAGSGPFALEARGVDRPANDDRAQSVALAPAGGRVSGSLQWATAEPEEPADCAPPVAASVWYRFATPSGPEGDGVLRLSLASQRSQYVAVYGPGGGQLSCRSKGSTVEVPVLPGSTYEVAVLAPRGYEPRANAVDFALDFSYLPSPENDDFTAATALGEQVPAVGSTDAATAEPGEPVCAGATKSVWYRYQPDANGLATFTLPNATGHTMGVYLGDSLSGLTRLGCSSAPVPELEAVVANGRTYYVRVAGASSEGFAVAVNRVPIDRPENDDRQSAKVLDLGGQLVDGDTFGASAEGGEVLQLCGDQAGSSSTVWYRFTAPADSDRVARVRLSSNHDLGFRLYRESAGGGLTEVRCLDRRVAARDEILDHALVPGATYFVQVAPTGANTNVTTAPTPFRIGLEDIPVPINDDVAAATVLADGVATAGDSGHSGLEAGEPAHRCVSLTGTPPRHTVWYRFEAPSDAKAVIGLESEGDHTIAIYQAGPDPVYGDFVPLQCVDVPAYDADAASPAVAAGRTYYVAVGARSYDDTSPFTIRLALVPHDGPVNDDFADAIELTDPDIEIGDSSLATRELGEPQSCALLAGALGEAGTVWYRFTTPAAEGLTRLRLTGMNSGAIGIYTGDAVDNLTKAHCGLAFYATGDVLALKLSPSTTYHLVLTAILSGADEGPFTLEYESAPHPANDDRAAATVLEGVDPAPAATDTRGATPEGSDPDWCVEGEGTAWYRYTPATDGVARIRVSAPTPLGTFSVHRGAAEYPLACGEDSFVPVGPQPIGPASGSVLVPLKKDATYFIVVGAPYRFADGRFEVDLDFRPAPGNDAIADAETLGVGGDGDVVAASAAGGTLAGSTRQPGFPGCDLYYQDASDVWYLVQPPTFGRMAVSVTGDPDASLGIVEGTSPSNVRTVSCDGSVRTMGTEVTGPHSASVFVRPDRKYWVQVYGPIRYDAPPFVVDVVFTPLVAQPTVSISDASVNEGDGAAKFTISLDQPMLSPASVNYETVAGSARAGDDFGAIAGTAEFPVGTTSVTVSVPVLQDPMDEDDESFGIRLVENSSVAVRDGWGDGLILDDDVEPVLHMAPASVREGDRGETTDLAFELRLSGPSGKSASVNYATADRTAMAGDYVATSGRIVFLPGETVKTVSVRVIGDNLPEPDEVLALLLLDPESVTLASTEIAGTILTDDGRSKRR